MQRNRGRHGILLTGAAFAALGFCGAVHAADAAAAATSTEGGTSLAEVIVTAQRRAERLQDVPASVVAVSPKELQTKNVRNLQDLTKIVPGVQINFSGFSTQPAIRGITTQTTGVGFENNVAVYIDGYYEPDNSLINANFANLSGIEVLKGPQGALFGRNATGGAFLISTLQPSDTLTGKVEGSYGSFNDVGASGYISGPIANHVRFSIAGSADQSDGYYKLLDANGSTIGNAAPTKNISLRVKLQADLTDKFTATAGFNFTELSDARGLLFTDQHYRFLLPPPVGQLYQNFTEATNHYNQMLNKQSEGTLTLSYKTPIGALTSWTGYSHTPVNQVFDFDASYADYTFSNVKFDTKVFQENLLYDITSVKNLDLLVGGNYFWYNVGLPYSQTYGGGKLTTSTTSEEYKESYAGFIDGTYHITHNLILDLGGRYTHESDESQSATTLFPSMLQVSVYTRDQSRVSFSNFSPKGSLRYEFSRNTDVYASISQGFRSGLTQGIATLGTVIFIPVKPEKVTAYEVGFKTAQSRVRFSTAGYYYDYTDIQIGITVPNPISPLSPINVVSNAPKATIYGIEGQVDWLPIDHLDIDLGGNWLHARYGGFPNATGNGLNAATGINATNQVQDWTGIQMTRAPNFTATLGANYDVEGVFGGSLLIAGNLKYTTSYIPNNPSLFGPLGPAGLQTTQRYVQPSYTLLNASLAWTDPTKHYTASFFVDNLTNELYHLSINGNVFGDYGTWAPQRTYRVRLAYDF